MSVICGFTWEKTLIGYILSPWGLVETVGGMKEFVGADRNDKDTEIRDEHSEGVTSPALFPQENIKT